VEGYSRGNKKTNKYFILFIYLFFIIRESCLFFIMDSSYAPQSPDLSSFISKPQPQPQHLQLSPPLQQQQHSDRAFNQIPEDYTPRSPTLPFTLPDSDLQQHQLQHHNPQGAFSQSERRFSEYADSTHYTPPIPASQHFGAASSSEYYPQQAIKAESSYDAFDTITADTMSRAPRAIKAESTSASAFAPSTSTKQPPPSVDIRTKFPVARIKRIMQADEEVGKVAQVTPVAVNKALELFMTALVLGAAERAREKGGKRITAAHLKSVVEADDQFDFLGEIVGRVQDAPEGAAKRKGGAARGGESDSDEDSGERKVKKGKGRRKKSEGS
jgi:hypothetical protein